MDEKPISGRALMYGQVIRIYRNRVELAHITDETQFGGVGVALRNKVPFLDVCSYLSLPLGGDRLQTATTPIIGKAFLEANGEQSIAYTTEKGPIYTIRTWGINLRKMLQDGKGNGVNAVDPQPFSAPPFPRL